MTPPKSALKSDTTKASQQSPHLTPSTSSTSQPSQTPSDKSHRLRFNEARESLSKFCGNTPATRYLPRHSALLQLAALAQDSEDLDALMVMIVEWRQAKRQVNSQTSNEIISRCMKLGRPDLALKLLANRPKYGVDLSSISVARALLHELIEAARSPVKSSKYTPVSSLQDDPFFLAALYPKFRLPEVWMEPVSSAMLASFGTSFPSKSTSHKRALALLKETTNAMPAEIHQDLSTTWKERRWANAGLMALKARSLNT